MHIQVVLSTLVALSIADADPYYSNYGVRTSLPYVYSHGLRSGYITPTVRTLHTAPVAPVAAVAPVTHVTRVAHVAPAVRVAPVSHVTHAVRVVPKVPVTRVSPVAPVAPAVRVAPVAPKVPVARVASVAPVAAVKSSIQSVTSSQFHSQDESGNFAFGYNNVNGAREESGNIQTGVTGSYTGADGQEINYVADRDGFRLVWDN